jgi:hypothetical protein
MMLGILMFCCRIPSRRRLGQLSRCREFHENWCRLSAARTDAVAHPDTLMYLLKRLDNAELGAVAPKMVKDLIRAKRLPKAFLDGHLMVAVDGVCVFSSHDYHCEQCVVITHQDGSMSYLHSMLEAKVVCRDGVTLSVMTEPITNAKTTTYDKQDCELNAFTRLAPRLKAAFPRTKLVLLVDSLYACAALFDICREHRWEFIVTFKRGSIPTLFDEAMTLLSLEPDHVKTRTTHGVSRRWRWLDNLEYLSRGRQFTLGFIDCRETHLSQPDNDTYFAWLTSLSPTRDNVDSYGSGGRLRWKIENEGNNQQKNGYSMEHFCDCSHSHALLGLFLLLQLAHTLMQLVARSSIVQGFETLEFLAYLLLESLRNTPLPGYLFAPELPPVQIRTAPP